MFKNLKAEMARAGITNCQIAEVLKINPATVSAKLNRYDRIKLCEAEKIRNAFFTNLQLDYLFAYEDKTA